MASETCVVVGHARKRRRAPKARTGCLTCRQRHLKCDERKPMCERCDNLRIECRGLGYGGTISAKNFTASAALQNYRAAVLWAPSEALPCSALEFRYFQLFRAYSAADLSGYFRSDFWSRLLFQQGHLDVSIKDAIIAIGALYKSIEIGQNLTTGGLAARSAYLEHLKCAFQHYQRSICNQRKAMKTGHVPRRTALISSLLFICFEILHGNQDSVVQQIICGLKLLQESGSPQAGVTSSFVDQIDEELSQIFARLDIQLRTMEDGRPERYNTTRRSSQLPPPIARASSSNSLTDEQLPSGIESLEEARQSWDALYPRIFHIRHKAEPYRYSLRADVPSDIVNGIERQTDDLLKWRVNFDYLFQETWNDISEANRLGASAIKISYHLAYIKISTSFMLVETVYDSFHLHFQEIVRLSRYLIETKRPSLSQKRIFSLDAVICIPLFVTGLKCRDRLLRREASSLLWHAERREGLWDLAQAATIVDWMTAIEEAGLEPDQAIPESHRFRLLDVNGNLQKRCGWARCGQPGNGAAEFINIKEINIKY